MLASLYGNGMSCTVTFGINTERRQDTINALRRALLEALGETPQEEDLPAEEAPLAGQQAGRHTAAPRVTGPQGSTETPTQPERVRPARRGWNPFRRKG